MNTIKFDMSTCTKCRHCVKACFVDVIRWDEEENAPVAAYPEDCVQCYVCEFTCPSKALEVIADYKKPVPSVV